MLYPVFVNLESRRCLVVGAGTVAARRLERLLDHGATVTVIAPVVKAAIEHLADDGKIILLRRNYTERVMDGAFLVIAATNDPEINATVVQDANRRNILVSRADGGGDGSFLTGSSIERGALQIAVCTAGSSPTLTSVITGQIAELYGAEWSSWTALFMQVRPYLQKLGTETIRRTVVNCILNDEFIAAHLKSGSLEEAEKAALQCISSHSA